MIQHQLAFPIGYPRLSHGRGRTYLQALRRALRSAWSAVIFNVGSTLQSSGRQGSCSVAISKIGSPSRLWALRPRAGEPWKGAGGARPGVYWATHKEHHLFQYSFVYAEAIAAIDLCVVPTVRFERLFAFVIISHGRRRLLWFAVTRHPTAEWLAQQIVEALPWDDADLGHSEQ